MSHRWQSFLLVVLALGSAPVSAGTTPAKSGGSVLWDSWYTVTVNGDVPYSYYSEKVTSEKDGKLHFLNHVWKREGDFINEEQLGAIAENDPVLTPIVFNFHSTYRTTETTIDGNDRGGELTVKIKQGDKDLPIVKRSLPKNIFLSVFFPVWLGRKLDSFKSGETKSFGTILEDNVEIGFATVMGNARLEKPDDFARLSDSRKFAVNYRDVRTYWWVDKKGMAIKIEMPEQHMKVEKVSQQKAESFLKAKSSE